MAGQGGRITCSRCGANNFDTVTACWKCGTALGTGSSVPSYAAAPSVSGNERVYAPPASYAAYATGGDPGVARRAALLLAFTIPWIGLPIGWAFMMIEDARKQAIGRFCATWSLVALIIHLFLMFLSMQALSAALMKVLPSLMGPSSSRTSGGTGGLEGSGNGLP